MSMQSQRDNYSDAYLAVINGLMRDHTYMDFTSQAVIGQVDRIAHGIAKEFAQRMENFNETMNEETE